jgi:hypothetical protein
MCLEKYKNSNKLQFSIQSSTQKDYIQNQQTWPLLLVIDYISLVKITASVEALSESSSLAVQPLTDVLSTVLLFVFKKHNI